MNYQNLIQNLNPQNLTTQTEPSTSSSNNTWLFKLVSDFVLQISNQTLPSILSPILNDPTFQNYFFNQLKSDPSTQRPLDPTPLKTLNSQPTILPAPTSAQPREILRRAQPIDLPDPDMQEDDKGLNGVEYDHVSGSLFVNGVSENDIYQGQIGDCYFLATLSAIAQTHPEFIEKSIQQNLDGTYTINFYDITLPNTTIQYDDNGAYMQYQRQTKKITVDTDLPQYYNSNLYAKGDSNNKELWVALYEKAYATLKNNDYDNIHGGTLSTGLEDMVGLDAKTYKHTSYSESELYSHIQTAMNLNYPITAGSNASPDGSRYTSDNLVYAHAYTVLELKEKNGEKYIQLRNPYGYKEWAGEGADTNDNGIFWMPFSDFKSNFYQTTTFNEIEYDGLFDPYRHPRRRI